MADKLIVLADLGRMKAYRVTRDEMSTTPRIEMINEFENVDAHGKMVDKVSDKAGRFPAANGNGEGGMSIGENHNLKTEMDRRLVKQLAASIDGLVKRTDPPVWFFAAGKEINQRIVDELSPEVCSRMKKNVFADLTKIAKSDLLSHFVS